MAEPTLGCLVQMIQGEIPAITEEQPPQYLIGATATGQASLRGDSSRRLALEDMVVLRADGQVEAWVLSSGPDPLDLLVVVERPGPDSRGPSPGVPRRGSGGGQRGDTVGGGDQRGGTEEGTVSRELSEGFFERLSGGFAAPVEDAAIVVGSTEPSPVRGSSAVAESSAMGASSAVGGTPIGQMGKARRKLFPGQPPGSE
jgi:hypothetical protein